MNIRRTKNWIAAIAVAAYGILAPPWLEAQESAAPAPAAALEASPSVQAEIQAMVETSAPAVSAEAKAPSGKGSLRFNFRGVPLETVLDYLSKSAGFIIVMEADVSGTIDVRSHMPLTKDEAVDLLNSVLMDKGYAAVRNERILRIVTTEEARTYPLPVKIGSVPDGIPKSDARVTQIIHVKYANAAQLIQDIQPLIPLDAVVTANASSNTILITDTQINIRRIAEIIEALDTAILEVSTVQVYTLKRANAEEMAQLINSIFQSQGGNSGRGGGGGSTSDRISEFISRIRSGGGFPGSGGRR